MALALDELVRQATIDIDDIDELNRDEFLEILNDLTFARVRGLVSTSEVLTARKLICDTFKIENDLPVTGEARDKRPVNYHKINVGRGVHNGVDVPRFARVFYNPFWEEDIYQLHNAFRQAAMIRNVLADIPLDFGISDPDDEMWTACRIHQYPSGGGFMSGHIDQILPTHALNAGLKGYFQPSIILSKKGVDFETGGGFILINDEYLYLEDYCDLGEIVVYNTHTVHGVYEVDLHKPYRQDSLAGRYSGLVSLYPRIWG